MTAIALLNTKSCFAPLEKFTYNSYFAKDTIEILKLNHDRNAKLSLAVISLECERPADQQVFADR